MDRIILLLQWLSGDDLDRRRTRSLDFEQVIQEIVDQSAWAPPPPIRQLVGRSIRRHDGAILTDIDSIATRDETLVLIDTKSYASVGAVEGLYSPTQNILGRLKHDVVAWRERVQYVRSNPVGRQYDFSAFTRIAGLVVVNGAHFMEQ